MKLPKQLNLNGEIYKIKDKKLESLVLGKCVYRKKEIQIDVSKHGKLKKSVEDTLYHELAHYFFTYYEISDEEALCEGFSKFIKNVVIKQCHTQK